MSAPDLYFDFRHTGLYYEGIVFSGDTKINLGLMNKDERMQLANILVEAADRILPHGFTVNIVEEES